jgi:hypothetical protein
MPKGFMTSVQAQQANTTNPDKALLLKLCKMKGDSSEHLSC